MSGQPIHPQTGVWGFIGRLKNIGVKDTTQVSDLDKLAEEMQRVFTVLDKFYGQKDICKDLETIQASCLSFIAEILEDASYLRSYGLAKSMSTNSLPVLSDDLKELQDVMSSIKVNHFTALAPFDNLETFSDNIKRLGHCLEVANALINAELPGDLTSQLISGQYHQNYVAYSRLEGTIIPLLDAEGDFRSKVVTLGGLNITEFFEAADINKIDLNIIIKRLNLLVDNQSEVSQWIDYCRSYCDVIDLGYEDLLQSFSNAQCPPVNLCLAFDHVLYRTLTQNALDEFAELKRFSGIQHETLQERFRELDRKIIDLSRKKLAATLSRKFINVGRGKGKTKEFTDSALIKHLCSLERPNVSLLNMIKRAGQAIQQMKPCFMMSPASCAQFINPQSNIEFDLVIIDEASQMRPEEAFGAIARGRQLIVVGDQKQLPPSPFFNRIYVRTDDDDDLDEEDRIVEDSILDRALGKLPSSPHQLRWHYRSQHESLIAFSNKHFYGDLIVFPSSTPTHSDLGVEFRKVDGLYKSRINIPEMQTVIDATVQFMHTCVCTDNYRSLGIVTVNQPQRELLLEEMERIFARDKEAEGYRRRYEDTLEPFFVKNLENVQGDERDVIFISTVYGPEGSGISPSQRFGPINSKVGHRRLNVLFTRAKQKVVLFSSLEPGDIIPTTKSNEGVKILKSYLEYAKLGRLDQGERTSREPDSNFEIMVAERLKQNGYEVEPQVGVAGYFVDMAVKDPSDPGTYILGIECDGATYHSAKSARDRDRIREEVLKARGWDIYRIWSTDWFTDPNRQTQKLTQHLHQMVERRKGMVRLVNEPVTQEKAIGHDSEIKVESPGSAAQESSVIVTTEKKNLLTSSIRGRQKQTSYPDPTVLKATIIKTFKELGLVSEGGVEYTTLEDLLLKRFEVDSIDTLLPWELEGLFDQLQKISAKRMQSKTLKKDQRTGPVSVASSEIAAKPDKTKQQKKYMSKKLSQARLPEYTNLDEYPADFFFRLASEAKQKNTFQPWERRLIFNIGRYRQNNWALSDKQEQHVLRLIDEAKVEQFSVTAELEQK